MVTYHTERLNEYGDVHNPAKNSEGREHLPCVEALRPQLVQSPPNGTRIKSALKNAEAQRQKCPEDYKKNQGPIDVVEHSCASLPW